MQIFWGIDFFLLSINDRFTKKKKKNTKNIREIEYLGNIKEIKYFGRKTDNKSLSCAILERQIQNF